MNEDKIEKINAQMRKGILQYCILSVLAKNDLYATDIINTLKDNNMIVVEGTLYPLLTRTKNEGMLDYYWEESNQGPPRKYYTLTPDGRQFLDALDKTWTELVLSVEAIKNNNHAAQNSD